MKESWASLRHFAGTAILAVLLLYGAAAGLMGSPVLDHAAHAQQGGSVPGQSLGNSSDSALWRAVREGQRFSVSIPDKQAGVLVQSEGDNWRAMRNGPLSIYGGWSLAAVIIILVAYFLVRGRIRIEHGESGRTVARFNGVDRFAHWLTAICFIVLAITGLNIMFGRYVLLPVLGPDVFAALTLAGKYAHNYVSFGFMLGVVMMFVLWVAQNIPNKHDLIWLVKGGGLLAKGVHPPAKKFNAGQKIVFWVVAIGGLSISLTGISLMFPFEVSMFAKTFAVINIVGTNLPVDLTAMEEVQLAQLWHAGVALGLIVMVIAHIYIGTLGLEGAFWAMGTGYVDENWAREHHPIWADEILGKPAEGASQAGDD